MINISVPLFDSFQFTVNLNFRWSNNSFVNRSTCENCPPVTSLTLSSYLRVCKLQTIRDSAFGNICNQKDWWYSVCICRTNIHTTILVRTYCECNRVLRESMVLINDSRHHKCNTSRNVKRECVHIKILTSVNNIWGR